MPRGGLIIAVLAGLALTATGCSDPKVGTIGGKVRVVAAENFWGASRASWAAPTRRCRA